MKVSAILEQQERIECGLKVKSDTIREVEVGALCTKDLHTISLRIARITRGGVEMFDGVEQNSLFASDPLSSRSSCKIKQEGAVAGLL